ncbi:MAG: hypothetical protein AB1567_10565 [bacterium]
MTKQQIKEYCEAEFENIDIVISELSSMVQTKKSEYSIPELAAISTFIHNFYNGIENILKRVLLYRQIETKNTPTWHKNLLKTSLAMGIIDNDLFDNLSNYLSFRHFFVHAYSFTLRWEDMEPFVDDLDSILSKFKFAIYNFIDNTN